MLALNLLLINNALFKKTGALMAIFNAGIILPLIICKNKRSNE